MKTMGLIGGMSWESTQLYYRLINQLTAQRLGGFHSAPMWLHSVDFSMIEQLQRKEAWEEAGRVLAQTANKLEAAGAEFLVLTANTMHIVADAIERACSIPLVHIADATAKAITARGLRRVGLLGTRFTMEKPFYVDRLRERHGLQVIVPERGTREEVHRVIYEELCHGRIEGRSRSFYQEAIAALAAAGAEGVIFGCTEIGLLLEPEDSALPVFDTAVLHAKAAVDFALTG